MNSTPASAAHRAFAWPTEPHLRKHGPSGYVNYRAYKPWLRDEYAFRCVYCLTRERWYPGGHEEFSVEHVTARSAANEGADEYDNLAYACCSCNRNRQDAELSVHPGAEPIGLHVILKADGSVDALTEAGRRLVRTCHLNRPLLVEFRRRLCSLLTILDSRHEDRSRSLLMELLGFPDDLPDLAAKRPPGGHNRNEGLASSYFERRRRGELPTTY